MHTRPANVTLPTGHLPTGPTALRRWMAASITLHAAILAAFLCARPPILSKASMPGDPNGHRNLLTYNPGSGMPTASSLRSGKDLSPTPAKSHTLTAPTPAQAAPASTTASTNPNPTPGADGLGDGNMTIALELSHPYPRPDLSPLPSGTRGDVVVDVVIDKTGHIASFTLAKGLGHGVDDAVLATIRQWTFQAATRDGQPIASEQELLFHYERG
jgi:protein TonB